MHTCKTIHGIHMCELITLLSLRFGYKRVARASVEEIHSMLLELGADQILLEQHEDGRTHD
jgi:hypothetical protein